MPIDWTPFVDFVRGRQRFLVTTHVRPDGDGLGAQLALRDALLQIGKEVRLVIASPFPARYRFMDPDNVIERFAPPGDAYRTADAVIVLDTGTWNQLGDFGPFLKTLHVPKSVIDHHITQDDLGALRFVDVSAEATGRLVYEAIQALDVPLSAAAANHLFAAVAMDTGWFRHANTSAATFDLAGQLVRAGADPHRLYDLLYEQNTVARLKLTGLALERLSAVGDGRVVFTEIRRTDYEKSGAVPQDSEDLVQYTRSVSSAEVGLLFMEQPAGGVKVSFRARNAVDVGRVAERFGGGGHRLASGATLPGTLEEAKAQVLPAVLAALPPAP